MPGAAAMTCRAPSEDGEGSIRAGTANEYATEKDADTLKVEICKVESHPLEQAGAGKQIRKRRKFHYGLLKFSRDAQ
jgi:hypothetical protein